MGIEKLVCSNCKGELEWDPGSHLFICKHCGTKFSPDNEFTYRYVDEAKIREIELERELKKPKSRKEENRDIIRIFVVLIACVACMFVPLLFIGLISLLFK